MRVVADQPLNQDSFLDFAVFTTDQFAFCSRGPFFIPHWWPWHTETPPLGTEPLPWPAKGHSALNGSSESCRPQSDEANKTTSPKSRDPIQRSPQHLPWRQTCILTESLSWSIKIPECVHFKTRELKWQNHLWTCWIWLFFFFYRSYRPGLYFYPKVTNNKTDLPRSSWCFLMPTFTCICSTQSADGTIWWISWFMVKLFCKI